jgi:hypothetical protein
MSTYEETVYEEKKLLNILSYFVCNIKWSSYIIVLGFTVVED